MDLPLLEPEAQFKKQEQYRHKCRIAAIEVEANTKIRKRSMGRSRPMRGDCVPGDMQDATRYQVKSPSVAGPMDGTSKSHRC